MFSDKHNYTFVHKIHTTCMPFTHELTSNSYNTFGYTGGGNSCVSSYTAVWDTGILSLCQLGYMMYTGQLYKMQEYDIKH